MSNIVFPDYSHSLLNLTNSILKYYGVKTEYSSLSQIDKILEEGISNTKKTSQRIKIFT